MASLKPKQITYENGYYWVYDAGSAYHVMRADVVTHHSVSESTYAHDADGLSIAIVLCDYLAKRAEK